MSKLGQDLNTIMNEDRSLHEAEYFQVVEAGRRLFRKIFPKKTRRATLTLIASVVTKDTFLMDWFASVLRQQRSISYEDVSNVFGETIAKWKDDWELDEDEFDSLSTDPFLAKVIHRAAVKHKPSGAKLKGLNWTEIEHLVSRISLRARRARNDADKQSVDELKKLVARLQKELGR